MADSARPLNIEILPGGILDLQLMRDLGDLDGELRKADLQTTPTGAEVPGVKSVDLIAAIAIGSLALSSVSTLITVLTYWSSKRPSYTVTMSSDELTQEISGLDKEGARKVIADLKESQNPGRLVVRVEKT